MIPELNVLKKQLTNSPAASHYAELFFYGVGENNTLSDRLGEVVRTNIDRYAKIPEVGTEAIGIKEIDSRLRTIIALFPSFLFVISNQLDKDGEFLNYPKYLRLSALASTVVKSQDTQIHSLLLLKQIGSEDSLRSLEEKAADTGGNRSYIPTLYFEDSQLLFQHPPNFEISTKINDLIEASYYFSGITQILLKYYFFAIWKAQNDTVARHINALFRRFFQTLVIQENTFWKNFKNGLTLRKQVSQTIREDLSDRRHPVLRKHVFEEIWNFHPLIQDGNIREHNPDIRTLLMKQMAGFISLNTSRLFYLLETVRFSKGKAYVIFLLKQLERTDNEKLFALSDFVGQEKTGKELNKIILDFTKSVPRSKRKLKNQTPFGQTQMETVYQTAATLRKHDARKKLNAKDGQKGMTYEQVPTFLKERLLKLYQRVKVEGALTQDGIPEYLAKFANAALPVISPIDIGGKQAVIGEFVDSSNEILREITDQGHLSSKEVEEFQESIDKKSEKLEIVNTKERTELVNDIGVTLTDASQKSDERKEAKERDAFLQKQLIPYGLEKKAKRISIIDFFTFPFGKYDGPDEDDWFNYHIRFLKLAVKKNKLDKSNFIKIFNAISHLPKPRYKKYFNIFPNEQFEVTTFMAVYDLWQNRAFDKLKILP